MGEYPDELIAQEIVAVLQGMTGMRSWGGTYPNPPTVEREWKDVTQVNKTPHLIVQLVSGSTLAIDRAGSADHAFYLGRSRFRVVGYVQGDALVSRETWLIRLKGDVIRTLYGHPKLNNGAAAVARQIDTFGEADELDDGEFDQLGSRWGGFAQMFIAESDQELEVA